MENMLYSIAGILIPFIGTSLGSSFVFFMRKNMSSKFQKMIVGFASGVMIAASIWSLILPAVEMAEEQGKTSWVPAAIGFALGVIFLICINKLAENLEKRENGRKINMLTFSVTLHNIPEGMAVGVCFAGFLSGNAGIALLEAIVLAIGIAIQNIPEGAIISMPLKIKGMGKKQAFWKGVLSGVVEPISAIITIILINIVVPILPYLLAFAAGAMLYVVVDELIPESQTNKSKDLMAFFTLIGFAIMMIMDIALG